MTLSLYRSAMKVREGWEESVAKIARPALVLWARNGPFAAPRFAERLGARVDGALHWFERCGHFWSYERPAEAAAALETFWATQG